MANKVMSLHDAVEKYVQDNDVLCLGGFTTNRKPYAAVYEILRQGKTGFVGWSGPAGKLWLYKRCTSFPCCNRER